MYPKIQKQTAVRLYTNLSNIGITGRNREMLIINTFKDKDGKCFSMSTLYK